jgi:hypothetical protein
MQLAWRHVLTVVFLSFAATLVGCGTKSGEPGTVDEQPDAGEGGGDVGGGDAGGGEDLVDAGHDGEPDGPERVTGAFVITVLATDQSPLAGAEVHVVDALTLAPLNPPATGTTGVDGKVTITIPPGRGTVALRAIHPDGPQEDIDFGFEDVYRIPPRTYLTILYSKNEVDALHAQAGTSADASKATVYTYVLGSDASTVGCATVTSQPAAGTTAYAGGSSSTRLQDPVAWMFNVAPGPVSITTNVNGVTKTVPLPRAKAGALNFAFSKFTSAELEGRTAGEPGISEQNPTALACLPRLPDLGCATASSAKSDTNGPEGTLFVRNARAGAVRLNWIDWSGAQRWYATIEPGETYRQPSFSGHRWIVKEGSGSNCVGLFRAEPGPAMIEVSGTDSTPPEPRWLCVSGDPLNWRELYSTCLEACMQLPDTTLMDTATCDAEQVRAALPDCGSCACKCVPRE